MFGSAAILVVALWTAAMPMAARVLPASSGPPNGLPRSPAVSQTVPDTSSPPDGSSRSPVATSSAQTDVPGGGPASPPAPLAGWNVIVIVIDALRADHLSCSGYKRDTSPFIDALAAEGTRFEQAYANSSFTRESVSVILTGRLPSRSGSTGWGAAPPRTAETLATRFRKAGYRTGFFSDQAMLTDRFTAGFDEARHLAPGFRVSRGGPNLSQRALEFIESSGDRPHFLYLHYLDPHGPYDPPDDFYLRFSPKIFPEPLALYDQVRLECERLKAGGFGPGDPRFEDLVLRYDAEVTFSDFSVALLFKRLEETGRDKRTLVVITADHGEEFLDHGYVEHAWTLYEESIRVPLIFWAPGAVPRAVVRGPVSLVDLLPTVLVLTGLPGSFAELDEGLPLFRLEEGRPVPQPPGKPVIAETLIEHRSLLHAVITPEWKYVAAQKWIPPAGRPDVVRNMGRLVRMYQEDPAKRRDPWGPVVHEECYRLETDPGERRNLVSEDGKITGGAPVDLLRSILDGYRRRCSPDADGKQEEEVLSPELKEKLKALGYL